MILQIQRRRRRKSSHPAQRAVDTAASLIGVEPIKKKKEKKNPHYIEWKGVKWNPTTSTAWWKSDVTHLLLHWVLQKFTALNFAWHFNDPSNAIKCTNKCFVHRQRHVSPHFSLYGFQIFNRWISPWELFRFPRLKATIYQQGGESPIKWNPQTLPMESFSPLFTPPPSFFFAMMICCADVGKSFPSHCKE